MRANRIISGVCPGLVSAQAIPSIWNVPAPPKLHLLQSSLCGTSSRKPTMIHWLAVALLPLSSPPSLLLGLSEGPEHIHPRVLQSLMGRSSHLCLSPPHQPLAQGPAEVTASLFSNFPLCVPSIQHKAWHQTGIIHSFIHSSVCQTQSTALF